MPPRKRPAAAIAPDPATEADALRDVVSNGTKTGLAETLTTLYNRGLLAEGFKPSARSKLRKDLSSAQRTHSNAQTPYGPLVQHVELPCHPKWEIIHPLALLHYLSTLCCAFATVMRDCVDVLKPLTLILYFDEICPGNALRPEKSRTLQAIYWAFSEWPQWLLSRVAAWPTFSVIRSTTVSKLAGGMGSLIKYVLHTFFPEDGHSLERGVTIMLSGTAFIVRGVFGGFLADEKAHKEVGSQKGASGFRPCPGCVNLLHRIPERDIIGGGLVCLNCADPSAFVLHSDDSIFEIADMLVANHANKGELDILEKSSGFKYEPDSILFDESLRRRQVYKPYTHMIRDWMHVVLNNGVANSQLFEILLVLKTICGVMSSDVLGYMLNFKLPHKRGKVAENWLGKNRFQRKKRQLASFAGIMLTLVPLMSAYLADCIGHLGRFIGEHIECFHLLSSIVGILALGPSGAMTQIGRCRRLIIEHARMFARLYPHSIKPKFHMLVMHIIADASRIGKCLSCFVTERKHRLTKKAALHSFRHIEQTVLRDLANRHCQTVSDPMSSLFRQTYFNLKPKVVHLDGIELYWSQSIVTTCGLLKVKDIIYLAGGRVAKVTNFWADATDLDGIYAQVLVYTCIGNSLYNTVAPVSDFVRVVDIVDAVAWARYEDGVIRVILPIIASL